jgi:hypothetical protein
MIVVSIPKAAYEEKIFSVTKETIHTLVKLGMRIEQTDP